nr:hypothetical protein [Candidatus Saccharibacteria bacterium]NIV03432.1 hypothetical protein [Calditrichia bacterium]NIV71646.1 hypothetical protein [Calditrichia bacterium]NIV98269.1 hypothetical protein [Candidatus Saccharibacteria bacterium]NIW78530.1 hypothetical protein [Calditrichia bacterium]
RQAYRGTKDKVKELLTFTSDGFKLQFGDDMTIFPSEEAAYFIQSHPKCPFKQFAFAGECEIDFKPYYIVANGPAHKPTTQIILLEK